MCEQRESLAAQKQDRKELLCRLHGTGFLLHPAHNISCTAYLIGISTSAQNYVFVL